MTRGFLISAGRGCCRLSRYTHAAKFIIFLAAVIVGFTVSLSRLLFGSESSSFGGSIGIAPFLLIGASTIEMIVSASEMTPAEITVSVSEISVSVPATVYVDRVDAVNRVDAISSGCVGGHRRVP